MKFLAKAFGNPYNTSASDMDTSSDIIGDVSFETNTITPEMYQIRATIDDTTMLTGEDKRQYIMKELAIELANSIVKSDKVMVSESPTLSPYTKEYKKGVKIIHPEASNFIQKNFKDNFLFPGMGETFDVIEIKKALRETYPERFL